MNITTSTSIAQLPSSGLTERAILCVRQWILGATTTTQPPPAALIETPVERQTSVTTARIQAITASGRQSAGQFGRIVDPVTVVRISVAKRLVDAPKSGSGHARPGFAHAAGRTSNRIVIIR